MPAGRDALGVQGCLTLGQGDDPLKAARGPPAWGESTLVGGGCKGARESGAGSALHCWCPRADAYLMY